MELAQELFDVYIKPVYEYCSAIWTSKVCKSSVDNMNRVYLKFLKRYLQVRKSSSARITYLICGAKPLNETIFENPTKSFQSINLSIPLPGHQLTLVRNKPEQPEPFEFNKEVPQKFWEILHTQMRLPSDQNSRKRFTSKIFDLQHVHNCIRPKSDFHNNANPTLCKCKICKKPMEWYHSCYQPILDESC